MTSAARAIAALHAARRTRIATLGRWPQIQSASLDVPPSACRMHVFVRATTPVHLRMRCAVLYGPDVDRIAWRVCGADRWHVPVQVTGADAIHVLLTGDGAADCEIVLRAA